MVHISSLSAVLNILTHTHDAIWSSNVKGGILAERQTCKTAIWHRVVLKVVMEKQIPQQSCTRDTLTIWNRRSGNRIILGRICRRSGGGGVHVGIDCGRAVPGVQETAVGTAPVGMSIVLHFS